MHFLPATIALSAIVAGSPAHKHPKNQHALPGARVAPCRCMQRGFSLVETIVATSLLAVALVTLAQFVGAGVQSGVAARTRAASTLMAAQKMEQLRALPWDDDRSPCPRTSRTISTPPGTSAARVRAAPCGDAIYVRRWSATPAPFSTGVLIIDVDVRLVGKGHGSTTLVTARARMTP